MGNQIGYLSDKLDALSRKLESVTAALPSEASERGGGAVDTVLFLIVGVLFILLIDTFFRLGRQTR